METRKFAYHIDSDKEYLTPAEMLKGFTELLLGMAHNHPDHAAARILDPRVTTWDRGDDGYRHEFDVLYFVADWE